jgi:crotonobetainyl-CoA:carnitine CoA-transferase CaiB-like acyl-CoA transferase
VSNTESEPGGILDGIRVLDLGRLLAAPICALLLGDLGADVIKIERPGTGDDSRRWPPLQGGESTYFLSVNRNKRGIALDMNSERGQDVFRSLLETADVVVENFRPGVMDRWGFGYEAVKEINPAIVYCSISGYGSTGPHASWPATDISMQAYSGLMSITGEPGRTPVRVGVSLADITAGMLAAYGVLAALLARKESGRGQLVSTSLLEGQMAMLCYHIASYMSTGRVPGPIGVAHPSVVPYTLFDTSDGKLCLAAFNDRLFQRSVEAIGLPELAEDPRFTTNSLRHEHRDELLLLLAERFQQETTARWIEILRAVEVPVSPVNTLADLEHDPQVIAGEMWQRITHPTAGEFTTFGFPVHLSEDPAALFKPPPVIGQHTAEVLREVNFTPAEIAELEAAGVVVSTEVPTEALDERSAR